VQDIKGSADFLHITVSVFAFAIAKLLPPSLPVHSPPCSISWSPDGELLLAVNASSGGQPTTALFKRQTWDTTHLVGHRQSVVAAAANPRMFFAPRKLQAARKAAAERMLRQVEGGDGSDDDGDGEDQQQQEDAAAGADSSADVYDDMPSMVCACSSNDKTVTVWSSELALPVLHCQQVRLGTEGGGSAGRGGKGGCKGDSMPERQWYWRQFQCCTASR
jgi:hypothetical protein